MYASIGLARCFGLAGLDKFQKSGGRFGSIRVYPKRGGFYLEVGTSLIAVGVFDIFSMLHWCLERNYVWNDWLLKRFLIRLK